MTLKRVAAVLVVALGLVGYAPLMGDDLAHGTGGERPTPGGIDRERAALELFERQGLRIPPIEIRFHETAEHCNGHLGLFRPSKSRISICSNYAFVLPHELAHAWLHETVGDSTRRAYLELRGLDRWHGNDIEWSERGVEDAARVIQSVLMSDGGRPGERRWDDKLAAYELLVGRPYQRQSVDRRPGA